jgi:hypothetical protein
VVRRPDKRPKSGQLSKADDEDFERIARRELKRIAAKHWEAMVGFWAMLPRAAPSTRRRLLLYGLQLCHDRGEVPPAKLVACLRADMEKPARGRVHDLAKMRAAAQYLVGHPKCSLSDIAVAIGMKPANKTTMRDYMRRPQFWRECNDFLIRSGQKGGTETELRRKLLVQTKIKC